jgi:hypothetical protein
MVLVVSKYRYIYYLYVGVYWCNYSIIVYVLLMFDRVQACFISALISFPYGAAALFGISCCDVL